MVAVNKKGGHKARLFYSLSIQLLFIGCDFLRFAVKVETLIQEVYPLKMSLKKEKERLLRFVHTSKKEPAMIALMFFKRSIRKERVRY